MKAYPGDVYETLELDIQVVTPMFGGDFWSELVREGAVTGVDENAIDRNTTVKRKS